MSEMIDPETFVLPCDVRVPPATVIRAGCALSTLLFAMSVPHRPKHFDHNHKAKFASLEEFRSAAFGDSA